MPTNELWNKGEVILLSAKKLRLDFTGMLAGTGKNLSLALPWSSDLLLTYKPKTTSASITTFSPFKQQSVMLRLSIPNTKILAFYSFCLFTFYSFMHNIQSVLHTLSITDISGG